MPIFYFFITKLQQCEIIRLIVQVYKHLNNIDVAWKWRFYPTLFRIIHDLTIPLHERVCKNCQILLNQGVHIGDFYLAQSLLLQNQLDKAEYHITRFLHHYPTHSDGVYLLAEIKRRTQQKQVAFELLKNILTHNKRGKTWQHLSNLVDDSSDFEQFYHLFTQAYPHHNQQALAYDLACHLSNAAVRAQNTQFALSFWRTQYRLSQGKPKLQAAKPPITRQYNDKKAAKALGDLKDYFDQRHITFFLISGTLLGCIREGKLLKHDKDIDIGVWDNHSVEDLANIIHNSGCFHVLPIYSNDILVIRHVNGVTIDIFIHYRQADDYWHASGKSQWHNSPFELHTYSFLNREYLIPANYDLYLTENYGDWHTPQLSFDSTLDTPNMTITSEPEFLIYLYKKMTFAVHSGKKPSERHLNVLQQNGEFLD